MAEKISKYCWATPKCGIRTAQIHFEKCKYNPKNEDFRFVIVRNPYARIVSFYVSKVLNHTALHGRNHQGGVIPHIKGGKLTFSFEQTVPLIQVNGGADRHIRYQSLGMRDTDKFHFVRCENWAEDMKVVCEQLGLDHAKYGYVWENRSVTTDSMTEYVGDKPAEWFVENGIPSDYNLFYNAETKKMVADEYAVDFSWLSAVYGDFEMVKPSK